MESRSKFWDAYETGARRGREVAPAFAERYDPKKLDPIKDGPLEFMVHLCHDTYMPGLMAIGEVSRMIPPSPYTRREKIGYRLGAYEAIMASLRSFQRTPTH